MQVEHPSGDITTNAYNGDGLQVSQDDGIAETRFVYDGNNRLLETDDTWTTEAEFTYVPLPYAHVISQRRDGDSSFYQFDVIRNVRQLTDAAQVVTDEYGFTAWGEPRSSSGTTVNSQLWKGQYLAYRRDPDAGPELQYALHHRNYDPRTGVFTTTDPAKDDLNLYRYVRNNPVNQEDPSGLEEIYGPPTPPERRRDDEPYVDVDPVTGGYRQVGAVRIPSQGMVIRPDGSVGTRMLGDPVPPERYALPPALIPHIQNERLNPQARGNPRPEANAPSEISQKVREGTTEAFRVALQWGEAATRWAEKRLTSAARTVADSAAWVEKQAGEAVSGVEAVVEAADNMLTAPDPEKDYWSQVGDKIRGMGQSVANTGEAIGEIVRSPIESARSAGEALLEPGTTMRRVGDSMREKSATSEGQGEVVGDVLSAIFGPKLGHKFLKRIKGTKLARQISDGLESGLEEARKIVGTERTPTSSPPGRARSDRPQEDLSSGSETAETRDAAIGRETEPATSTQSPTTGTVAPKTRPEDFAEEAARRVEAARKGRVHELYVMDVSQHPRITNPNPLVKQLESGIDPKTVVPDSAIIVRGGQDYVHQPGNVISGQMGSTSADAAAGLPHGTVREITAGEIRKAGGIVELVPEPVYPGGPVNTWHVNVTEGPKPVFPEQGIPSPAKKADRLLPPRN